MPKVVTAFFSDNEAADKFVADNKNTYFFVEKVKPETLRGRIKRKKSDGAKAMCGWREYS